MFESVPGIKQFWTVRGKYLALGNNKCLWLGGNSRLTGIHRLGALTTVPRRPSKLRLIPLFRRIKFSLSYISTQADFPVVLFHLLKYSNSISYYLTFLSMVPQCSVLYSIAYKFMSNNVFLVYYLENVLLVYNLKNCVACLFTMLKHVLFVYYVETCLACLLCWKLSCLFNMLKHVLPVY